MAVIAATSQRQPQITAQSPDRQLAELHCRRQPQQPQGVQPCAERPGERATGDAPGQDTGRHREPKQDGQIRIYIEAPAARW